MTLPAVARSLVVLGRSIGFAAAALSIALSAWWGSEVIRYLFFSEDPTLGEVGFLPVVLTLRMVAAAWVTWGVLRFDPRRSLHLFFGVGVGCFLVLFGWYFVLLGPVRDFFSYDNLPYLLAVCDLLYVAAGLVVGCALLWPTASSRIGDSSR